MRSHSLVLALALLAPPALPPAARADAVPIGSLHCNDAGGAPKLAGRAVTVTGVVVGQFSSARNLRLFVQDATGAVCVFGAPRNCVPVGDSVRVAGVLAGYNGLTEITGSAATPLALDTLGRAARMPAPLALTLAQVLATAQPDGCEPDESRLIAVDGVRVLAGGGAPLPPGATFADNTNYRLVAGADTSAYVVLRVTDPEGCDLSRSLEGQPIPVGPARVVGILSQYTGRGMTSGGYQILPRSRDDVGPAGNAKH